MNEQPKTVRLLSDGEPLPGGCVAVEGSLPFLGETVDLRLAVPTGLVRLADVTGAARAICDEFTRRVIRAVAAAGGRITCSKGCGACCTSFLVPMTVPEALRLMADLQALPPRERRLLEPRFLQAEEKLVAADLAGQISSLDPSDPHSPAEQRELAGKWWSENRFPCPLLKDQACGLYRSRPIPCREFLALSPPQRCATNTETRARRPFSMHAVVSTWAAEFEGTRPTLVLMANLLGWWQHNAERAQREWPGAILVRRLVEILAETARRSEATYQGPIPPAGDDR